MDTCSRVVQGVANMSDHSGERKVTSHETEKPSRITSDAKDRNNCPKGGLPKDDRVASFRFLKSTPRRCENSKKDFVRAVLQGSPKIWGLAIGLKQHRKRITDFVKQSYFAYSHVKLGDQDKPWAPHKVCKTCVENLGLWKKGKLERIKIWSAYGVERTTNSP